MIKNQIEMTVCTQNGGKIKEYSFNDLSFIEAIKDSEFIIKIRNNSSRRALASISVDGRCAISGGEAKDSDEGYVVSAYSQIEIKGFRISDNEVAAFKFTDGVKSYCSELERQEGKIKDGEVAANNGVIGVRVTWEREKPTPQVIYKDRIIYRDYPYYRDPYIWPNYPYYNQPYTIWCNSQGYGGVANSANSSVNCVQSSLENNSEQKSAPNNLNNVLRAANFDLGTTWGEKKNDKVAHVSFERSTEVFTLEIHYASRSALESMGVDLNPKKQISIPSAFGEKKYCSPPSGWEK